LGIWKLCLTSRRKKKRDSGVRIQDIVRNLEEKEEDFLTTDFHRLHRLRKKKRKIFIHR